MIIDTHAHLYYPDIISNLDEILDNARESGIGKIIIPAVDIKTCETILNLTSKHDMLYAALGLHPCDIKETEESEFKILEDMLTEKKVVGIGETGLDYYWDKTYNDKQKLFFKRHLELASSYKLPVIIHTRDSMKDALEVIRNLKSEITCQFHCFSGDEEDLEYVLGKENYYVSFCGNITYKNFDALDLIEKTPIERLLSETDSPFLTPVPYRGKKNQPAYVVNTINKIAEIKKTDKDILIDALLSNTEKLFRNITF
ncbi:MAG: TatD family hydrolase [Ignavibacteria bacterium]|nr:TatD family hydrolase [Ignavibacteria bacterium]